ncbi:hypothetical protein ACJJTC_002674 [Scirpophaga incertulas]
MEETLVEDTAAAPAPKMSGYTLHSLKGLIRSVAILLFAAILGLCHYKYSWKLFDNDRNFTYLSDLEREMSLRTEMGFYYSYYKTLVQDYPFTTGITRIMYDKLVEHPKEVNAFNRFNIHPEVIIGAMYHYFEPWLNKSEHIECRIVSREYFGPVKSCVGLGVPMFFYLEAVWVLAGIAVVAIFLQSTVISENILGGFVAVAQFFANHNDATRVHWTPNERENFAWPLLLLQAWLVCLQLRDKEKRITFQLQLGIFTLNCLTLLFWQFTQFIFLTQIIIFFVMEQLYIIDNKSLCILLHAHFCGLHMAVLLLQGNDMLKTSLYASFFVTVSIYCLFFSNLRIKIVNRLDIFMEAWFVTLRMGIAICSSLYIKKVITEFVGVEEDSHIWDLLFSKFNKEYVNFHTLMYTCSAAYTFLPIETVVNICKTSLIPSVLTAIFLALHRWLQNGLQSRIKKVEDMSKKNHDEEDSGIENADTKSKKKKKRKSFDGDSIDKDRPGGRDEWLVFLRHLKIEADVFYCIAQLIVYGVMAVLVMRLKLLFVTQLCIVSGLLMKTKYYLTPQNKEQRLKYSSIAWLLLAALGHSLYRNISQELSYISEFQDPMLEELLVWVSNHTHQGAAFAGSMSLMATVMLSTRRPIVVHPHYEHVEARQRTYAVYKAYGRFPSTELYDELTKLGVSYLILESRLCYGRSSENCTFEEIWEHERPDLTREPLLCRQLHTADHFYQLFKNSHYAVYRMHDLSVQYMPRIFDT